MNRLLNAVAVLMIMILCATNVYAADNVYKYEGAPASFDAPLDIHGITATATIQADGKYTLAFYADPEGGAIFCGGEDGVMTEDFRMRRYAPSAGYSYEYYLGNLTGKQRKDMPKGVLDQAKKRVVFKDVVLTPGQKNVRLNLVVKITGPDGKPLKAPDPNGFYGWTTDDPDKSVVGIKDNGWLFDVELDGTLQAKGLDFRKPS